MVKKPSLLIGNIMQDIELQEITSNDGEGQAVVPRDYSLLNKLNVELTVQIGTKQLTVDELFSLKQGQVLQLNESVDQAVNLLLEDKVVAKGSLTVSGDNFAIKITEVSA